MCGRFSLSAKPENLATQFVLPFLPEISPRWNITPGTRISAVRVSTEGRHSFTGLEWGLIPSWSKDATMGRKLANARAETIHEKPSFRGAFRDRRCIIPADGYYEWKVGEDGKKRPWYFRMEDEGLFGFAGLWETWTSPEGDVRETCCLLTIRPNELCATVHDRMPVILPFEDHDMWLDPGYKNTNFLLAVMRPFPAEQMKAWPVSLKVNNPKANTADLTTPWDESSS